MTLLMTFQRFRRTSYFQISALIVGNFNVDVDCSEGIQISSSVYWIGIQTACRRNDICQSAKGYTLELLKQADSGLIRGIPKVSDTELYNSNGELFDDHYIITSILNIRCNIKEEIVLRLAYSGTLILLISKMNFHYTASTSPWHNDYVIR